MTPWLKTLLIHGGLFVITFLTTTLAGAEWTSGKSILVEGYSWADFATGLPYSISFLLILGCHEFGHYFTARYYDVKTSLPYFIPIPPPLPFTLGTLGALIRIRQKVRSTQQNFDIGIAGPLAGFVVAIGVLMYGFTQLPPPEYIFQIHPEYAKYGLDYAAHVYDHANMKSGGFDVYIGKSMMYRFMEFLFADPARTPNVHEIIHYPILFAGFLSLLFTSINLLPIGQLDGGHVLYGLVGYSLHKIIASCFYIAFLFYAGLGYVQPSEPVKDLLWDIPFYLGFLYLCMMGLKWSTKDTILAALSMFTLQYVIAMAQPTWVGYSGWLFFALLLGRFIGIPHPPSEVEGQLSSSRKMLGWVALIIFVLCLSPNPLEITLFAESTH